MPINEFERILVTGGSGFVGRAVTSELIAHGMRPIVLDRNIAESDSSGAFDVARVDLADHTALGNLVTDYRPDLVIHLAGVNVRDDPTGTQNDVINFRATSSLIEQAFAVGSRKLVMMGSAAEYGDNPIPFREGMEPRPVSSYGRSKAKATAFALDYSARTGFDVTVLRVFTAYGPGQPANMFLSQLVRHAVLNQHFKMSDGTQRRDFVFIPDVLRALFAAASSKSASGRVVNIGSGRSIALRETAEYVWKLCGADPDGLKIGALTKQGDDKFDTQADISLAGELLNWYPTIAFETGIMTMIDEARLRSEDFAT